MNEQLIKSDERVKSLGEVFTPKEIVDFMIDQPEIAEKARDITATFLEPAAGEGAFLVELLKRKIKAAAAQSENAKMFGEKSLIALSSLYGIELMEDNVEMLVMNLYYTFCELYHEGLAAYNKPLDKNVLKSAKTIIQANMVQGDALKKTDASGKPLIFSEWRLVPKSRKNETQKVERLEFTFEEIIDGQSESHGKLTPDKDGEQVAMLFMPKALVSEEQEKTETYAVVPIVEVWKKETVNT